jgi:uncharacterized membrane protein YfcA
MIRIIAIAVAVLALLLVAFLLFSRKQKPWNSMTEEEQRRKKVLVTSGLAVFVAGLLTALLAGKKK